MNRGIAFSVVLLSFQVQAQTDKQVDKPLSSSKVIVNGSQTDMDVSRDAIAGKIVIGKQRIAESGVQNVAELLRREPAISIGKDGRPGLLGMPGYTQILVDGVTPVGDALGLDLVHVERIEILKSTTAATGPFGIAGTINIVRRKAERKAFTQTSAGASSTGGRAGASLSWLNNQIAADNPFVYNLTLSARRSSAPAASHYVETRGVGLPEFEGDSSSSSVFQAILAASEMTWTPAPGHKLALMPDLGRIKTPSSAAERRRWTDGSALAVQQEVGATLDSVTLPVRWNWQIDADSSLMLRLAISDLRIGNDALRREENTVDATHLRRNRLRQHGRNHFLDLDYHTALAGGHEITAGGKLVRNDKDQTYDDSIDGQPDPSLQVFGRDNTTRMDSSRLYLQDEWRIDRTLALNAGLSVERRVYTFDEGAQRSRADFNMWSPSMHLSKKIGGDRKRQVRLSLARSFQPPESDQMLLHPTIDRFAPCRPGSLCGANDIETADRSGNPGLQPERALGLNLSYTHGIGSGSEVLVEGYARDIHDKTGYEFALANVPWASVPRWVVRPVNLGQARVRGVNFEGRVAGKDLSKDLSTLEVHGSLGFARSELSDVPGPDNRIDGQLPWRLKLGGSYTLKAAPLKLGVEASVLPADWVRDSVRQRIYQSGRNTLGVNGSWKIDAKSRLTLNLDNLLHKSRTRIEEYQGGPELLHLTSGNADYARISVKFDTSL